MENSTVPCPPPKLKAEISSLEMTESLLWRDFLMNRAVYKSQEIRILLIANQI